jgi:hypothetical protein
VPTQDPPLISAAPTKNDDSLVFWGWCVSGILAVGLVIAGTARSSYSKGRHHVGNSTQHDTDVLEEIMTSQNDADTQLIQTVKEEP